MWADYLIKSKIHSILNVSSEGLHPEFLLMTEDYPEHRKLQATYSDAWRASRHSDSVSAGGYTTEARDQHLLQVALIVNAVGGTVQQIKGGLLHDIVGTSGWTTEAVYHHYGEVVGTIVEGLHSGIMNPEAMTVKLACIIAKLHNAIKRERPDLDGMIETIRLSLPSLKSGNSILLSTIYDIFEHYKQKEVS